MSQNPKTGDIISACIEEFAEYGYEKANTNRICERAGVSKGLIFHYFGSKRKLYLEATEKCVNDLTARFDGFSADGMDYSQSLLAYIRLKADFFSENPLHYKIIAGALHLTACFHSIWGMQNMWILINGRVSGNLIKTNKLF